MGTYAPFTPVAVQMFRVAHPQNTPKRNTALQGLIPFALEVILNFGFAGITNKVIPSPCRTAIRWKLFALCVGKPPLADWTTRHFQQNCLTVTPSPRLSNWTFPNWILRSEERRVGKECR